MAIHDIYSKRKAREERAELDIFDYSNIPESLRVQIILILRETIGNPDSHFNYPHHWKPVYKTLVEILRKEYGVFYLTGAQSYRYDDDHLQELTDFFISPATNTDQALDVIELSFKMINRLESFDWYLGNANAVTKKRSADALEELNTRFKEHGIGYCYTDGLIIRVDSSFIHKTAVIPALNVLHQAGYENAEKEFLSAHAHYRHGRNSEALVDCCKSFESVMKIICDRRQWAHSPNAPAKQLIETCLQNELIPPFWQNHFTGLRQILESAIPTPRNKAGGHGAGTSTTAKPTDELTSYVLHMTAATILFLTEAEKKLS